MNYAAHVRRAVVMLTPGRGAPTPPTIGNRSLHYFWALLKPHFRSVFLPPQSQADSLSTQWTWREPAKPAPPSSAELATLRKRLLSAQRSLSDAAEAAPESTSSDSRRATAVLPQLAAQLDAIVNALAAHPDAVLAGYVARSEQGLLLHSWGLPSPLQPRYPDNTDCEIAGTVFAAGCAAPGRDVVLEAAEGAPPERTRSDATGGFRFQKVASGRYRVRVDSPRESFSPEGVSVEIKGASITGLELHDSSLPAGAIAGNSAPRRRRLLPFISIGALAIAAAVAGWWHSNARPTIRLGATPVVAEANVAPATISRRAPAIDEQPVPLQPKAPATAIKRPMEKSAGADAAKTRPSSSPSLTRESIERSEMMINRPVAGVALAPSGPPTARAAGLDATTAQGVASPGAATSASAVSSSSLTANGSSSISGSPSGAGIATPTPHPFPAQTTPPPAPTTAPNSAATPPPSPAPSSKSPSAPHSSVAGSESVSTPADPVASDVTPGGNPDAVSSSESEPSPATADSPTRDHIAAPAPRSESATKSAEAAATTGEETLPPTPADDLHSQAAVTTANRPSFSGFVKIRTAPWHLRLLHDDILPTAPTPLGREEPIEETRERLLRERRTQLPPSFEHPSIQIGFALDLSASGPDSSNPQWRGANGIATARIAPSGNRAEISWSDQSWAAADIMLVAADGHELARVSADERGTLTLHTASGVRGWPWIGLARTLADDPPTTPPERATRLDWRVLSGAPALSSWRRDDQWLGQHGHRLDLVPAKAGHGPRTHLLALVDRTSGWAIAGEVEEFNDSLDAVQRHAP